MLKIPTHLKNFLGEPVKKLVPFIIIKYHSKLQLILASDRILRLRQNINISGQRTLALSSSFFLKMEEFLL